MIRWRSMPRMGRVLRFGTKEQCLPGLEVVHTGRDGAKHHGGRDLAVRRKDRCRGYKMVVLGHIRNSGTSTDQVNELLIPLVRLIDESSVLLHTGPGIPVTGFSIRSLNPTCYAGGDARLPDRASDIRSHACDQSVGRCCPDILSRTIIRTATN